MADVARALDALPESTAAQVNVVFITTDPERDTPAVLREWLDLFDSRFIGLTGTRDEINRAQSLVEAVVPAGARTRLHRHRETEELYHVTAGEGVLTLGSERLKVSPGDTALIPPGTPHCIEATGAEALRILCCCSPAYRHEDTEILETRAGKAE